MANFSKHLCLIILIRSVCGARTWLRGLILVVLLGVSLAFYQPPPDKKSLDCQDFCTSTGFQVLPRISARPQDPGIAKDFCTSAGFQVLPRTSARPQDSWFCKGLLHVHRIPGFAKDFCTSTGFQVLPRTSARPEDSR